MEQVCDDGGRIAFEGFCLLREAPRTFMLHRIASRLTDPNTGEVLSLVEHFGIPRQAIPDEGLWPCDTPEAVAREYDEQLRALGWDLVVGEPTPGMSERYKGTLLVGVYRHFKNGKRLKHPDIWIEHVPTLDVGKEDDSGEWHEEIITNPSPWRLGFRGGRATSYTSFADASLAFLRVSLFGEVK